MECRVGCGACCIAPSIKSAIPGMPNGKPAAVRCIQLDDANGCKLFFSAERPDVCKNFHAEPSVCGDTTEQALVLISELENKTNS
jgi:Fe-S-cluster containining protein